jgi:hypothetical protein
MTRTLYAIKSDLGFLRDIEEYTTDVERAVTFVDYDTAFYRLKLCCDQLKHNCKVVTVQSPFPRKTAKQINGQIL